MLKHVFKLSLAAVLAVVWVLSLAIALQFIAGLLTAPNDASVTLGVCTVLVTFILLTLAAWEIVQFAVRSVDALRRELAYWIEKHNLKD